MKTWKSPAFNN